MKFSDVFAWEVDFLTEVRNGDKFRLLYEEYQTDSGFVKYGEILAAEYIKPETTYMAVLFEDPTGHKEYYNSLGKSLKKSFLRSPLNYRKITSRFSKSRLHPVLKIYRPHLGVDYAAPVGTPVVSAGDGTVLFLGWKKGLGKCVEIRHSNNLTTIYGHLSGFASNLRFGKKVEQKEVIGYVGLTGLTTGPHLDYRVKKSGNFVNPLKVTYEPSPPLKKEYLAEFSQLKENLFSGMELLLHPSLASK
jgi:murein DD-endopeptidase MepM/ murein hydrolase activator NlpD